MSIYESFFALLPEPCLITDCDDRVLDLNVALESLLGYDANELIGKPVREIIGGNFSKNTCEPAGKLEIPTGRSAQGICLYPKGSSPLECSYQISQIHNRIGDASGWVYLIYPEDQVEDRANPARGLVGDWIAGPGWSLQDGILNAALIHLFEMTGLTGVELWGYDWKEGIFRPQFLWGNWEPNGFRIDNLKFSVASRVLETRQAEFPALHSSTLDNAQFNQEMLAGVACLPCTLGDQVFGVVWFGQKEQFDPADQQTLMVFADLISGSLEKNYLDHLARNRGDRLEALRKIEIAIKESYDLKVAMRVLLNQVLQQLTVDGAAILLLKPNGLDLDLIARRGFRTSFSPQIKFRLGQHPPGKVAADRLPLHIPTIRETSGHTDWEMWMAAEGFVGYYGVPLIARGAIKGVLEIFSRQTLHADLAWEGFLEAAAGQAAIAIDKWELFENWQRSIASLDLSYDSTLLGWMRALRLRDEHTSVPDQKMIDKTLELATLFGVPDQALVQLRRGVILHDIGKIGIPDHILFKPGPLSDEEWTVMRRHPEIAYELLAPISYLKEAVEIPYNHHERWDGLGYPRGLKADEIPLGARIFSVVDVWAAMTSPRPYRDAISAQVVRKYIEENADRHFDRRIVKVFLGLV